MGQAETARILGIDRRTYVRYEEKTRRIPLRIAVKFAAFYGVTIDYLVGRSDRRASAPQG
ncbi:hypothetical protein CE91St45_07640 [Oscillospiraceae bacterium]|nr:hypothetical protein CE91St45_07640 [Oscillospiraceae bacterium]